MAVGIIGVKSRISWVITCIESKVLCFCHNLCIPFKHINHVNLCSMQTLSWSPMTSSSWYSCLCIIPSRWMGRNGVLFLTNRTQRLMEYLFCDYLTCNCKFCFANRLLPFLALMKPPAMLWTAFWNSPVARNWGLPLTASKEFRPLVTQPTGIQSCQRLCK